MSPPLAVRLTTEPVEKMETMPLKALAPAGIARLIVSPYSRTLETAAIIAERLRVKIADKVRVQHNGAELRFTASFGVAQCEEHDTLDALVARGANVGLILPGHYASERPAVEDLAARLADPGQALAQAADRARTQARERDERSLRLLAATCGGAVGRSLRACAAVRRGVAGGLTLKACAISFCCP